MRPIRLEFNGINSYKIKQDIDFERLISRGVFGIVGKTGAGKTTVIDAIILALYGKIPRYDGVSGTKNFINNDLNECFVKFEFSINVGKITETYLIYRAYKIRKNDAISQYNSKLVQIKGEEEFILADKATEIDNKLLGILGLSYDDFTKAVILPQGKFNEFLSLKNSEKGKMLGRIFSLEKYGEPLFNKFSKEKAEYDKKISLTESTIKAIGEQVDLKSIKEEIKRDSKENEEKNKKVKILELEEEKNKENFNLLREYTINKREQEKEQLNKNSIEELEKNIEKYRNSSNIILKIDKVKTIEKALKENKELEEALFLKIKELTSKLKIIEKEEADFFIFKEEKFNKLINKINDIQTIIKESNLEEDDKNLNILIDKIKEKDLISKNLDIEQKKFSENLELLNIKEKEISNRIIENTVKTSYVTIVNQGITLEEKNKEIYKNIEILTANKIKFEEEIKVLVSELDKIEKSRENLIDIENKQKENKKLFYSFMLKKELKIGDICPICNDIIEDLSTVDNVDKNFDENLENNIKDLSIKIIEINNKIENKKNEVNKINEELLKQEQNTKNNLTEINIIKSENNISDLIEELKNIQNKETFIEKATLELVKIKEEIEKSSLAINSINIKINGTNLELVDLKLKKEHLSEKINSIRNKILEKTEGKEINQYLNSLINEKEYFILKEKELINNKENTKTDINKINLEITTNTLNIKNLSQQIVELEKEIEVDIEKFKYINIKDILNYKVTEQELSEYIKSIQDYKDKINVLVENEKQLVLKLKEVMPNFLEVELNLFREELISKHKEIENIREEITQLTKKISRLETELKRAEEDLLKVQKLNKDKEEFVKISDKLEIITKLLSGNRFVQFIAKRYLIQICKDASGRLFNMSGGKYSLELDETDFLILDHNRGDIKRLVKSISGGEQFMVSLCLALSLSTYISSKNSGTMDMFFLDEGFGSLDDETLDNVVQILFNASEQKVAIGLITHVTKLQEDLPIKLVVKDGFYNSKENENEKIYTSMVRVE